MTMWKSLFVFVFTQGAISALLPSLYFHCEECLHAASQFTKLAASNGTYDQIRPALISLCTFMLSKAHKRGETICPSLVDSYGPPTLFIVAQSLLSPLDICRKLEFCPKERRRANERMKAKHPHVKTGSPRRKRPLVTDKSSLIRILHLTDIHLDHKYDPGTSVDCGFFICCRPDLGGSGKAGAFGAYSCDLPLTTLDHLTGYLKTMDPQPDFIIYTGDNPSHDVWEESPESQAEATDFLVKYMSVHFPDKTIYPALGNHETFPESFYYPPFYRNVTRELSRVWKTWVDLSESAAKTIEAGAYYTLLIRPGLRLLALNTDFGYQLNLYNLLDNTTSVFQQQRDWIDATLKEAEENNEKVVLIGHVPPGIFGSIESYGDFYVPLIQKYKDVVVAQLFGHTHRDQFQVVHGDNGADPVGVVLISPPVTTFVDVNPSFRIYLMDPETFELVDYEQYHINLTEANRLAALNRTDEVKWFKAYTAREEYGLPDLSAQSWWDMSERMRHDFDLFERFHDNYNARSDATRKYCEFLCRENFVCGLQSAAKSQYIDCVYHIL
eukprot:m.59311 g.59311  ORF g.59311 m.59311 type:complete len:554 (+) comp34881_c0_seq1:24-1685(+)